MKDVSLPPLTEDEARHCEDRDGYGIHRFSCGYTGPSHDTCIWWQVHSLHRGRQPFAVGRAFNSLRQAEQEADERRANRKRIIAVREQIDAAAGRAAAAQTAMGPPGRGAVCRSSELAEAGAAVGAGK